MSSAAMSQMLDVRAGPWAGDLLAAVDVPLDLLPPLHRAGAPASALTDPRLLWWPVPPGRPS
jgi:sugar (pentulose or hexulose) kinase